LYFYSGKEKKYLVDELFTKRCIERRVMQCWLIESLYEDVEHIFTPKKEKKKRNGSAITYV